MNPVTHPYNLEIDPLLFAIVIGGLLLFGIIVYIVDKFKKNEKEN